MLNQLRQLLELIQALYKLSKFQNNYYYQQINLCYHVYFPQKLKRYNIQELEQQIHNIWKQKYNILEQKLQNIIEKRINQNKEQTQILNIKITQQNTIIDDLSLINIQPNQYKNQILQKMLSNKINQQINKITEQIQTRLNQANKQFKINSFYCQNIQPGKKIIQSSILFIINPINKINKNAQTFLNFDCKLSVKNSPIINQTDCYVKLVDFFSKKVKYLSLLFKASENDFNLKKYFQICGDQTNTIIICLNQYDKIIGGFTPLNFDPGQLTHNHHATDTSESSFVFSLTTNQKFQLKNKSKAILRRENRKIIDFGAGYFMILDQANQQRFSSLSFDQQELLIYTYSRIKYLQILILQQQSRIFTNTILMIVEQNIQILIAYQIIKKRKS